MTKTYNRYLLTPGPSARTALQWQGCSFPEAHKACLCHLQNLAHTRLCCRTFSESPGNAGLFHTHISSFGSVLNNRDTFITKKHYHGLIILKSRSQKLQRELLRGASCPLFFSVMISSDSSDSEHTREAQSMLTLVMEGRDALLKTECLARCGGSCF